MSIEFTRELGISAPQPVMKLETTKNKKCSNITTITTVKQKELGWNDEPRNFCTEQHVVKKGGLPPRSRTGCWTCRTRKVKCDEKHPKCGQCSRLGHGCDYSPRIQFRDDTDRIRERTKGISTRGSIVWDPEAEDEYDMFRDCPISPSIDTNLLPRFADLTNDDDRELKAASKKPGTYNLICVPDSFTSDDEGMDDMNTYVNSIAHSVKGENDPDEPWTSTTFTIAGDTPSPPSEISEPDVVFLKRFEESASTIPPPLSRRSTTQRKSESHPPSTVGFPTPSIEMEAERQSQLLMWALSTTETDEKDIDSKYLQYYRENIKPSLVKTHDLDLMNRIQGNLMTIDVFEMESISFPPLFHAIIALSAMSSSHRNGSLDVDALVHYSHALPVLRTSHEKPSDLASDPTLYTHFLLLAYEILAARQGPECMWPVNLAQLLQILLTRIEVRGKEQLPLLVWHIVIIDVYATLTAGGPGDIVSALVANDLLPDPTDMINSTLSGISAADPPAGPILESVLIFQRKVVLLASKLGTLSNQMKAPVQAISSAVAETESFVLLQELDTIWQVGRPVIDIPYESASPVYPRICEIYEHACALHGACIIFAHTSIWPLQRMNLVEPATSIVRTAIKRILSQASKLTELGVSECRFLIFPLFIAGTESGDWTEKMYIAELMQKFESGSIGRSAKVVREILCGVYDRQNEAMVMNGHFLDVDWHEFMKEKGYRAVIFDL